MSKTGSTKITAGRVLLWILLVPLYAMYGVCVVLRWMLRLPRLARGTRAILSDEIYCPNGHPNATRGRFECGACHGVYHGWVGECPRCGAGASWFPCGTCGVSIPLPWESP